jgi:hypothetical protein
MRHFRRSGILPFALALSSYCATSILIVGPSDITPTLTNVLDTLDALPTPDSQGYYRFQKKFGVYYELCDYDKLLSDARKRNRVFMDKLTFVANTKDWSFGRWEAWG